MASGLFTKKTKVCHNAFHRTPVGALEDAFRMEPLLRYALPS